MFARAAVLPLSTVRSRSSCGLLALLLLLGGRIAAGDETIVFQADFEAASPAGPPAGWSMWGAQRYKNPADFTQDEHLVHSGQACFRIHHPANTGGYVVSAPEASIRPQPGTMLTATFWARSDRSGEAMFGWTAYRQVKPFVDAPSPGLVPLAVDQQWRRFQFVLYEGWDFFAEDCQHLLLTLKATGREEEERTLWIDDVRGHAAGLASRGSVGQPRRGSITPPWTTACGRGPSSHLSWMQSDEFERPTVRLAAYRFTAWPVGEDCLLIGKAATCCRRNWKRRFARCNCP